MYNLCVKIEIDCHIKRFRNKLLESWLENLCNEGTQFLPKMQ